MPAPLQIDSLSDATLERLSHDAASHGVSPGEWAARVLETYYPPAPLSPRLPADTEAALKKLFGSWDEEQVRTFDETMAESDKIDESLWK